VQDAKPLLRNSLRRFVLATRNLTRRSHGTRVLPETIGYILCAGNPVRLAQVLRILHEALPPCLGPSGITAYRNIPQGIDKSMQSRV
jgi:hypothetical protein